MHRIWRSLVLLTKLVPLVAYGPLQLNFGPPDLAVDGWEAAFATVTGTPFLQLNSQVPPAFGFWGGDYQGATHEAGDSDASSSFSQLPDGAYLCLMSVPIGSYNLEVSVGNHSGSASSCLELESGARIYDGSTTSIQKAAAVVHKEALDSCLTLRSCVADAVVNTWKVEEIQCHSSCAFCTATGEADCAISCNDGRSLTSGQNGSFCLARVPYAPSSLSASQVTNSSLRLSWVSGFSGGEEITDHRVLLEGVEFGRTGSTDAFVDLSGLEGDTVYSFQVQAMSAAGLGDLSEPLTVRTSPVLPWAPLELVVMAVGQYRANMSWSTPSYDGGASIVGYLVSAGDLSWSTAITEVAADGLQGYTWYTFQVQALTSAGLGAVNATTLRTLEVPPGPVQQLQVASVEQYTISLQWSAPLLDGGSNISGYQIWCEAIEGAGNFTADVPDENLSVRLEGLHGYTHYQCFVVASNALGLGESASIQERTLAVPPYQPGQPVLLQEDLHFVEISWTVAEGDPGANLTGYKIYGRTDGTWYVVINDTQCTNTTWQISNLEMYTAYDFAVAGLNDVGEGERSNSTAAFTAAVGVPHPPSEPLLNASHSSIEASWTLMNDGGTNVTGYVIELAADGAFDVVLNVSDSTFGVVQGLLGNLTYKVRVRAVTSSGAWSYPSTSVEVRTSFPVEPSQVPQLDVSALAPHTALANWTPVVDLGGSLLQGYEVVVKEGETVTTVIQTTEASVEITQLMGLQNYQFFVYAENGIGRSPSTSANLTMPEAEVPGVPQGLQVSNASFEWAAPQHDGGAALWGFEVWGQVDEDNWTMQEMTNETRINLTDLIGDTSYRYQVRAVNRIGAGSFAVSDVLHTGPSVPMAPRELKPVEVGQYQLRLTWLAPLKDGGAPIFAYRIWQRTGTGSLVLAVNSTESNATEVIVESLTRTTAYSFVVAGVNTLGVGSLSEESMQVWTLPVAPAAVEQLQLEPSPSMLNFTWEAPDDGGLPIDFYTIEMHLEDLEDLESGFFLVGNLSSSGCRCFQLTDLMANRSYRLQIFAWNAVGRSPEAPKTLQTSEPDVPSAVQQLLVVMGNYSADLAWQPPAETGGLSGLYYEVTAIADHQLVQTTTETFVTIETLLGSRAYNVSVVACNTLGCGAASTISNLQTAAAEDQALLAGQAASIAAIAAGLTAEQAAQAAGAAAANTAQNVGLSPELQTSLAATAAAQAAKVNQLSAQKQAELAGEAAASAGALANMSMTELASAAGSAVSFVGSQAGLTPEELAVLAAQSATAVLQHHYNASLSQQAQVASAAVAVALTNASLTPAEEALLTGASVLTALRSGSGCDAELVAHAGEAAQSVASRTSMNVSDQAATSGQAAAQAAANCSMSPAMQAQLAGAAAAAAGATANLSSDEQTALAGQAASVAAIAAGLTAEQAAQAAGAAAANTAQNVGLSPELQTSLAATAAAQAANVNQLSAQKQAEVAGEAAASAGALANMNVTQIATVAASAAESVALEAGLSPSQASQLSSDALELAEERADCQLTTRDELRCLHRCMAKRLLMTLDTSDLLSCSGSFDETRVADELVFQMDFGSRPANFAQRLLLALGDLARGGNVGLAGLRSGSVRVALAVSGSGSAEDFADLEVLLSDVDQLKTLDSDLFATVQDTTTTSSTATSTQTTSSALEDSTSRPTTSTLAASSSTLMVSSGNVTSTGPATSTVATSEMTTWTTTGADEGNESDGSDGSNESNASLADPQFLLVDLPDDPRGLGVEIHVVLAVGATLLVTFAAVMWCCMRKALRSVESVDDFGGILPTPKPTEAWAAPETQVPATDVDARRSFRKEADNDAAWPVASTSKARSEGCEAAPSTPRRERVGMGTNSLIALEEAETALATPGWEGAPETPRRERVGMGTNTLVALEEADNSEGQGVTCVAATRTLAEPAKTAEVVSKPDVLQQLLSELQDENDPNEFNLPEEPDALQDLFGALGMQLPSVAVPPERGHTAWSLPGDVEGASRGSPANSTATLLQ